MNHHGPCIDWVAFAENIQTVLDRSNIRLRKLCHALRLHHSTLSRAASGKQCTAEVYITLCLWMKSRPTLFFKLGALPPNFYLFKASEGTVQQEGADGEPPLAPNVTHQITQSTTFRDQSMLGGGEVRRIRGNAPTVDGPSIDWASFASTLESRMDRFNISLRDLQNSSGVHYSTLSRVANGKQCSAVAYLTLCAWMMLEPTKFYRLSSA